MLLMSAVRQSARNTISTRMTSTQPTSSARLRFRSDISMNVAGRKMVGSTAIPASAGFMSSSASSTPRVTVSVFAPSCFSTISIRPGPLLMTASPMGAGKPSTTVATSPMRSTAPFRDDTTIDFEVADGGHGRGMGDREPLVRRVEEAAGLERDALARGPDDLVDRDAVRAEPFGIDEHLQLAIALAPDGDVGDAGNGHQPRPDRPLRQRAQLDLRQRVRRQPDLHDAAERRQRRQHHRRTRDGWQLRRGARQPLLHHLARRHHVGRRIEDQHDRRQAEHRFRADPVAGPGCR